MENHIKHKRTVQRYNAISLVRIREISIIEQRKYSYSYLSGIAKLSIMIRPT